MKNSTSRKPSNLRKGWVLGATLPAFMLASGMAVMQVHAGDDKQAGYDKKGEMESDARAAGEAIKDGWITTKVKSKLVADEEVSGFDISVETRDKVVYLSGEVENQSQVSHAVEIAEDTEGVERADSTKLRISTAVNQAQDAIDRSS